MNINRVLVLALVSGLFLGLSTVQAAPRGGSNQARDFLVGSSENQGWSCGLMFLMRDKDVALDGRVGELTDEKVAAYVGHTIFPWVTLYGIAGTESSSFTTRPPAEDDQSFLWGAALDFDLFTHEIQDPVIMENAIRLNLTLSYYDSEVESFGETIDMGQFDAALTASILNDLDGIAIYMPESIALFAGPVYSEISGDLDDSPDESVGLTAGMEVFQTKRVSYYLRVENFSNLGYGAGLNVRF